MDKAAEANADGTRGASQAAAGTEASSRVADVLLAFLNGKERGVSDIARELGLSKAVVHRILRSLASRGLVQHAVETKRYQLGVGAAALGATALRSIDLRMVALPLLRNLARVTGETATISALVGHHRVYLDQILSQQTIRMQVEIGVAYPLHAGASSRAILAFAPEDLQNDVLRGAALQRLTSNTITDTDELERSLAETRKLGFAVSIGERQADAASIAAPVWDAMSEVVGAISVCGPSTRFGMSAMDGLATLVHEAASEASRRLGWHGPPA